MNAVHLGEIPSINGSPISDLDAQNIVVKLEEVTEWEENPPQNPSTNGPSTSDSDVQNVEVKVEEISDWEEYNQEY